MKVANKTFAHGKSMRASQQFHAIFSNEMINDLLDGCLVQIDTHITWNIMR
jgi:hypothetical protein